MSRRWSRPLLFALGAAALSPACTPQNRIPKVPLPVRWAEGSPRGGDGPLAIMLPGRISPTREFQSEGFFAMLADRHPEVDAVAADLHLAYFRNGTMVERLRTDVVKPASAAGGRELWLVGISLGGLGATIYALERPEDIRRVVLLSPFLGEEEIIAEIEAAGGLAKWEPGEVTEGDNDRRLWRELKRLASSRWGERAPEIWLGYTEEDRFTRSNALFSREILGGKRTFIVPGRHDWPEWRELFATILEDPDFAR